MPMRILDSEMPTEDYWEFLFDVPLIISRLGIAGRHDIAELGCGYGTFTVPVAKVITGTLYAFDIDPAMVARTAERTTGLPVFCMQRDVVELGFGFTVDTVLLFNVLHGEWAVDVLRHAANALSEGGEVLVIHWRHANTPRGPSLDIRPRPEEIIQWAAAADLKVLSNVIDLPHWHYGLRLGLIE